MSYTPPLNRRPLPQQAIGRPAAPASHPLPQATAQVRTNADPIEGTDNAEPTSLKQFKESMSYRNDLTPAQIEEIVSRETAKLRARLKDAFLSAATIGRFFGISHSRIAAKYEKGTPVSVIIAEAPSCRPVNLDKLIGKLTPEQREELAKRLQEAG